MLNQVLKTVLIVDDAYFMRNFIKNQLKKAGYEIVGEAKDGKEGVKRYFELKPDFVTMDVNMPNMDGIEATRQILSKDKNARIIAVSGVTDEETKAKMKEAGAVSYLEKPFQPAFLLSRIDALTEPLPELEAKTNEVAIPAEDSFLEDDDFFSEEIELLSEPVPSEDREIVIENEHNEIEFPEEYDTEADKHALTKEKVEEEVRQLEQQRLEEEQAYSFDEEKEKEAEPVNVLNEQQKLNEWRLEQIRLSQLKKDNESAEETPVTAPPVTAPKEKDLMTAIRPPRSQMQKNIPPHLRDDDDTEEMEEPIIQMNTSASSKSSSQKPVSKEKKKFSFISNLFKR